MVGELPAQLLGNFIAQGLGPFRVVGPQINVDEAPAVVIADLCTQAIDIIIVSFQGNDSGFAKQRPGDLGRFDVIGNKKQTGKTGLGTVGGNGAGQIARGGTGKDRVA